MPLAIDPKRRGIEIHTGIFVRAKDGDFFDTFDIAELDACSMVEWLRSRGGKNEWAEGALMILLGYTQGERDAYL